MARSENGSLFFADDVCLLASSFCDLQHPLERFTAECEAVGMRVSASSAEAMVLCRKMGDWLAGVGPLLLHIERSQLSWFGI